MHDRVQLGQAIVSARHAKRMTQRQLADRTTLSRPAIANIEAGRQATSVDTLCAIADALDVSAGQLLAQQPDSLLPKLLARQAKIIEALNEAARLIIALSRESEATFAILKVMTKPEPEAPPQPSSETIGQLYERLPPGMWVNIAEHGIVAKRWGEAMAEDGPDTSSGEPDPGGP